MLFIAPLTILKPALYPSNVVPTAPLASLLDREMRELSSSANLVAPPVIRLRISSCVCPIPVFKSSINVKHGAVALGASLFITAALAKPPDSIEVLVKLKVLVPPIPNLKVSSALSQNPVSPSPNANCGAAAEPATAPGLTIT